MFKVKWFKEMLLLINNSCNKTQRRFLLFVKVNDFFLRLYIKDVIINGSCELSFEVNRFGFCKLSLNKRTNLQHVILIDKCLTL